MLLGHGYLATSDVNAAFCSFSAASSPAEKNAWEQWTSALVSKAPDSDVAHYLHGDALARLHQVDAAILEFRHALELNPQSTLAQNARGVVFTVTGRYNPALLDFSEVSVKHPKFVDAYINRGYLYIQQSSSAASQKKAFGQALKARPDAVLAMVGEGRAASASGSLLAGVDEVDHAPLTCKALDQATIEDRNGLFAWAQKQEPLQRTKVSDYAGMSLDSAMTKFREHPTTENGQALYNFASKTNQLPAVGRMLSAMVTANPHKFATPANDMLAAAQSDRDKLQKATVFDQNATYNVSHSQISNLGAGTDIGVKGLGHVGAGSGVQIKDTYSVQGSLSNFAQLEHQNFLKANTNLNTFKQNFAPNGGAETVHIRFAQMELDNAPRIYHNTLIYSGPVVPSPDQESNK
jgi:tetratricopeptide (TPR) repeat protein